MVATRRAVTAKPSASPARAASPASPASSRSPAPKKESKKKAVGKKKEPEIAKAVPLLNVNENVSTSSLQSTSSRKSAASSKKAASVGKSKTAAVSDAAPKCTSFSTCCASAIKMYLIVYNAVSAVGWGYLLFQLAHSFFVTQPQNHRVLFGKTGVYLAHLQTAAVLEVLHAALGWVHSGVVSNAVQLTSRLFVAWIAALHAGTGQHWAYGMMATAWGLSDLTRYLYYLTQLLGCPAPVLKWARYTFFLVLYPVGTLGEAILIFLARLKWAADPVRNYGLLAVLAVYTPGFLYMYSHMLHQRAKHVGGPAAGISASPAVRSTRRKTK